MAQLAKHLLYKGEDLSVEPQGSRKNQAQTLALEMGQGRARQIPVLMDQPV